jgi:hypothetical protein
MISVPAESDSAPNFRIVKVYGPASFVPFGSVAVQPMRSPTA